MRNAALLAALLLAGLAGLPGRAASATVDKKELTLEQRQWLEEEDLLIRKEERKQFFSLAGSYQRDQFIRDWWKSRDPDPETPANEFKLAWEARKVEVRSRYDNLTEDRARTFLLHGEPASIRKPDCDQHLWPIEVWTYQGGGSLPHDYVLGISKPYLGAFVSVASDWNPLKHYTNAFDTFNRPQLDPTDVWQFKNFLITEGD